MVTRAQQREAYMLHILGWSWAEIGRRQRVTPQTARWRASRYTEERTLEQTGYLSLPVEGCDEHTDCRTLTRSLARRRR